MGHDILDGTRHWGLPVPRTPFEISSLGGSMTSRTARCHIEIPPQFWGLTGSPFQQVEVHAISRFLPLKIQFQRELNVSRTL